MGKIKKNVKWAETAATAIFHQSPTSPDRPSLIQRLKLIRRRINRPANPRSAALPSIFRSCRSSIPHTPVWPPPFSCAAAVLTLSLSSLPNPPRIPQWFLLLHQPEPPLVPCLLAWAVSSCTARAAAHPRPVEAAAHGGWIRRRPPRPQDSRSATSFIHGSASTYVSYLGSFVRHLRRLLSHLAGGDHYPLLCSKIHAVRPRPPLPGFVSSPGNLLLYLLLVDFVQTLIPFLFVVFRFAASIALVFTGDVEQNLQRSSC